MIQCQQYIGHRMIIEFSILVRPVLKSCYLYRRKTIVDSVTISTIGSWLRPSADIYRNNIFIILMFDVSHASFLRSECLVARQSCRFRSHLVSISIYVLSDMIIRSSNCYCWPALNRPVDIASGFTFYHGRFTNITIFFVLIIFLLYW